MGYADIILADNPVAYWRLGESSGTTADNAEGTAARDGTYTGTYTLGQASSLVGDSNTAVLLNGGYISVPYSSAVHPGDSFTWEARIKRSSTGVLQALWGSGEANTVYLFFNSANSLVMRKDSVATICETDGYYTDTASFHHIVFTKNGASYAIYYDGSAATIADIGNQTLSAGTGAQSIGAVGGGAPLYGTIDEVALYDYALTSTQVAAHYSAATTSPVGVATGTGAAYSPSGPRSAIASVATGTGAAYTLGAPGIEGFQVGAFQADAFQQRQQLTPATATGSAHSPTATTKTNAVFPAWGTGAGAAYGVTARLHNGMTTGVATGTGTAHNLNEVTAEAVTATGTGTGIAAFWSPPIGTATGTGSATGTVGGVGPVTVTATGAGAAQGNDASLGPTAILAEGTGTANNITAGKSSTSSILETATATSEALGTDPKVGATSVVAAGTGGAANATATTVTGAYATSVLATATGAAAAPAATVGVAAGTGAGTAEAHSLDSSTTFTAGAAAATGAGYGTATKFSVPVGVATGVGAAVPLSFALRPQGGIATSTGAALAGSSALGVPAGAASASGTAHVLTWSGTSRVSVTAGVATGTGLARSSKRGHRGGVPPRGHGHHWTPRAEAATVS